MSDYDRKHIDEPICQCVFCTKPIYADSNHWCNYSYFQQKELKRRCADRTWFVVTSEQTRLTKELDDNRKPSIIPDTEFHEQYELLKNDLDKNDQ